MRFSAVLKMIKQADKEIIMGQIKGIIFDMDGVLIQSEVYMCECAKAALNEFGIVAKDEDFQPFVGSGEDKYVGGVAELYGIPYDTAMKDRAYELYITNAKTGIHVMPGILKLFAELADAGFKIAIASSADRIKVDTNIRAIGIQEQMLSGLVTGDQIIHKKPAPDIFLEAAKRMHLQPDECIVVEDALNGVQAALAAGMKCIGITGTFTRHELMEAGAIHSEDETYDAAAYLIKNEKAF